MINVLRTVMILIWLCIPVMGLAKSVLLSNVKLTDDFEKTRFVFDFNKRFNYKKLNLAHPNRLVIDFDNAKMPKSLATLPLAKTLVKSIRTAYHQDKNGKSFRVVFDLKGTPQINVVYPIKHPQGIYRLIVDVKKPIHKLRLSQPPVKKPREKSIVNKAKVAKLASAKPIRDIMVVIDPGHGGKDPGASGIRGTKEKNVVLSIARKLQYEINKQQGFKAVLTRKGDYYISLRRRLVLAHKYKADMFVAIHADAYRHNRAHGASVYALSPRGATSEAARWLAKKENESEFVGGLALGDKDYLVRSVLIDLSQTHTIGVSLQMGSDMLYELSKFAALHHPGVEQAAFVVLKSPDIPSLLVETGFLSNHLEERNLTSTRYQYKIALAIKRGVVSYFLTYPPRGTRLAYWNETKRKSS